MSENITVLQQVLGKGSDLFVLLFGLYFTVQMKKSLWAFKIHF